MVSGLVVTAGLVAACSGAGDETRDGGAGGSGGMSSLPTSRRPLCDDLDPPTGGVPAARADSDGALSADGRTLLVFGGDVDTVICGQPPAREHVAETWLLDTACGDWRELTGAGPEARARHTVVSDFARNRAILFGGRTRPSGQTGKYTLFNDVWVFDFGSETWAPLATSGTGPTPRANAASVMIGDDLWVFGGNSSTSGLTFTPHNDLFALNVVTGAWRQVAAAGTLPAARLFHAMTADPKNGRLYIAHGGDENAFIGPFFTDVWGFDVATSSWSKVNAGAAATAPEGRIKLGLSLRQSANDNEPSGLFLVGGHDDGTLGNRNDTLLLPLPNDTPLSQLGGLIWQPTIVGDTFNNPSTAQCQFPADFTTVDTAAFERRSAFAFAPNVTGEAFVVFAGDSDCGRLSDAWWYDSRAGVWEAIRETLPGLTCPRTGNSNCASLCG